MKFYKSGFRKARVEIIPMIDTIFFLLVYFMFLTLQMVKMQAMDVNIPKPSPPSNAVPPPKIMVKVDAGGNYSVNGASESPDGIAYAIQQDINKSPESLVVVRRRSDAIRSAAHQLPGRG